MSRSQGCFELSYEPKEDMFVRYRSFLTQQNPSSHCHHSHSCICIQEETKISSNPGGGEKKGKKKEKKKKKGRKKLES